jgi:hypothetical protein
LRYMNNEEVDRLLSVQPYKFAKTMASIPHSYTLKESWADKALFDLIVQFIRDNGVKEKFFSKTYIYYYANGYKYWTMGNSIEVTKLINRAEII